MVRGTLTVRRRSIFQGHSKFFQVIPNLGSADKNFNWTESTKFRQSGRLTYTKECASGQFSIKFIICKFRFVAKNKEVGHDLKKMSGGFDFA